MALYALENTIHAYIHSYTKSVTNQLHVLLNACYFYNVLIYILRFVVNFSNMYCHTLSMKS